MKVSIVGGGPGGLYFALLAQKAWPRWDITVYERNRPDDTFGFGVVFSDQTLDTFKAYDGPSYEMIRRRFAYWGDVDVVYKGRTMRSGGNGFCGCSRVALLHILHDRCRELGVKLKFQHEVEDLNEFSDSDLVVIADGINSKLREKDKQHFQPSVDLRPNKFTWLGSTRPLDAFKYFFRETPEGIILAHCYQYEEGRSTWVIETDEATWKNFGFDKMGEGEMLPVLERVFAAELEGHPLVANRSIWRNFPTIVNQTWVMGKAVLVGDAKATAHFSIGSGTKLAMEDAIALYEALKKEGEVKRALATYDTARREEVEKTQHAANVSLAWFEHMQRYWGMAPEQFAFGVMSRSKQITWENLELRDPRFIHEIHKWFAQQVKAQGFDGEGRKRGLDLSVRDDERRARVAGKRVRPAQGLGQSKPRGEAGACEPCRHVGKERPLAAEEMGHAGDLEPKPVIAVGVQGGAIAARRPAGEVEKGVFILFGRGRQGEKMGADGAGIGEAEAGEETFAETCRIDRSEQESALLGADNG